MKSIIRISLSVLLCLVCFILTVASSSPYGGRLLIVPLILMMVGGGMLSLTIATWSKGEWKIAFRNSLEYSIGISALIYIVGFLVTALEPIFIS